MSNDENKYGLVEDVSESKEFVEDEQVQDEEIIEAKARKEAEEKDDDEEEVKESDEDDEDEEEVKEDSDEDDDEDEKELKITKNLHSKLVQSHHLHVPFSHV